MVGGVSGLMEPGSSGHELTRLTSHQDSLVSDQMMGELGERGREGGREGGREREEVREGGKGGEGEREGGRGEEVREGEEVRGVWGHCAEGLKVTVQWALYLVTCRKEVSHFSVVVTTLQGQVPCHLHEPASLILVPVLSLREPLFCRLHIRYEAVKGTPGGGAKIVRVREQDAYSILTASLEIRSKTSTSIGSSICKIFMVPDFSSRVLALGSQVPQ